jgi:hypothetical protein
LLLPAACAFAQGQDEGNKKDPQSSFEPRNGPGAGQKLMEKMVGDWDVVKSIFPRDKEPVRTKGTCHQTMMHDGRFLKSEFTFEEKDGTKTSGLGILGYDPKTDTFTSVWTDSRSTRMSLRQSEGKFNGEEVVLYGKSLDNGGTDARHSRTVAHLEDGGRKLIHRQYIPSPDGNEFIIMELMMTRK